MKILIKKNNRYADFPLQFYDLKEAVSGYLTSLRDIYSPSLIKEFTYYYFFFKLCLCRTSFVSKTFYNFDFSVWIFGDKYS